MDMDSADATPTDPLAELDEATNAFRDTEEALEAARADVHAKIVAALKAGERPRDVAAHSPYDRNHVNRIRREAGIPPRR